MKLVTESAIEHQSACRQYVNAAGSYGSPTLLVPGTCTTCLISTCTSCAAITRADS